LIFLEDVWVNLRDFELRGITLSVSKGEYFIVMGPSGAGKTVLLQTILGIYKPWRGKIFIDGVDVTDYPPEKRGLSYVPQNYGLFPHMTVEENIAFGLKVRGYSRREVKRRVREIADVLGISHLLHRNPKTLSGGEQQRVALARALVVEPKAILLDEPLSALDYRTREEVIKFLQKLHSSLKFTAIHVTHDIVEALELGTRVALMFNGKVVYSGQLTEILCNPHYVGLLSSQGLVNFLEGKVVGFINGVLLVDLCGVVIKVKSTTKIGAGSRVLLAVNSGDLEIHKDSTGAGNVLRCRVEKMKYRLSYYEVLVRYNGIKLKVCASTREVKKLNLKPGDSVWVRIPEDCVKVVYS